MNEPVRRRARSMEELAALFERKADPHQRERSIAAYRPRPTDVIITPFAKSGTTWTQQIFHTLRTRGDMAFDDISRVVPWIETSERLGLDINAEQRAEPRGFKSHLGYDEIPKGARYIVAIRDPVDAAYSGFRFLEGWYLEPGTVSADEFVIERAKEAAYHKHLLSWWPHRGDDDVLYLVYEHMQRDPGSAIRRIAEFAGIELDEALFEMTLEHSSLAFMQRHRDRFDDAMMRAKSEEVLLPAGSDSAKVRTGKVGAHGLGPRAIEALARNWREIVRPLVGFDSYEALIDSLR